MTKSIREEIGQAIDHNLLITDNWDTDKEAMVEDIANLFRTWVLECVGEDERSLHRKPRLQEDFEANAFANGYNQAKQEIRKKIEEATE